MIRYIGAAEGSISPKYVLAAEKLLTADNIVSIATDALWHIHDRSATDSSGKYSLLDIKYALARRILADCTLCEHQCRANRVGGEYGYCKAGAETYYHFEQVLLGEEKPVIPSHEVFFSGCNMRCKYCYSWQSLDNPEYGMLIDPHEFNKIIKLRKQQGAINLNLIGGEPTIHLHNILNILRHLKTPTPVVWNSNFYMSLDAMRLLDGVVDLYLGDFKFGNDVCAQQIGGLTGYLETITRNLTIAKTNTDMIIRHLLLPGHIDCCLVPVAEWISKNMPNVPFNLMFQYTPFYRALDDNNLCRSLSNDEINRAKEIVISYNLNTDKWNKPMQSARLPEQDSTGELETTVIVRPDGQVVFMHLHRDLLKVVHSLENGDI